jgi:broad specificity phosphatase PhoE
MPTIYMIRHGEAAAGWGEDLDPGLSERGRVQAEAAAVIMQTRAPSPLRIVSSPLRRCRETASPLAQRWRSEAAIDERVAEVPSSAASLDERAAWLRQIWRCEWNELPELHAWRRSVVDALNELKNDTVIFTHYVAINVAVGEATKDNRLICFRPDNASVTVLETGSGTLRLVEKGREGETRVN